MPRLQERGVSARGRIVGHICASAVVLGAFSGHAQEPVPDSQRIEHGERLFHLYCATCHGRTGDGWGERHDITYARPRSFLSARFKLATTKNRVPSDSDIERTIRLGMPGSGMPSWSQLSPAEIAALARFVRQLGIEALRVALAREIAAGEIDSVEAASRLAERTIPGAPVAVPAEPPVDPERRQRGERIYREACAPCHGLDGRSPQAAAKSDFEGNWLPPTSLAAGIFKGGGDGRQLFIRLATGMEGTGMPAYDSAYSGDELWDVVHHVQALARGEIASEITAEISATKPVGEVPIEVVAANDTVRGRVLLEPPPAAGSARPAGRFGLGGWIALGVLLAGAALLLSMFLRRRA